MFSVMVIESPGGFLFFRCGKDRSKRRSQLLTPNDQSSTIPLQQLRPQRLPLQKQKIVQALLHGKLQDMVITDEFQMVRIDSLPRMSKSVFNYARSFTRFGRCSYDFGQDCSVCAWWINDTFLNSSAVRALNELLKAVDNNDMDSFKNTRTEIVNYLKEHHVPIEAAANELTNFVKSVSTPQHDFSEPGDYGDMAPLLPPTSPKESEFSRIRKDDLHRSKKFAILHLNRLAAALKRCTLEEKDTTESGQYEIKWRCKRPHGSSSGQKALKLLNVNHGHGLKCRTVFKALFVEALEDLFVQVHEIEDAWMALWEHDPVL